MNIISQMQFKKAIRKFKNELENLEGNKIWEYSNVTLKIICFEKEGFENFIFW